MPQLRSLIQPVFGDVAFRRLVAVVREPTSKTESLPTAALPGLTPTAKALVCAGLANELARPIIVLTSDNDSADRLRSTAATFLSWLEGPAAEATVSSLPAFDSSPYEGRSPHPEISERRAGALWNAARGYTRLLFVPLSAALGRFREPAYYRSLALDLKPGDEVSLVDLVEHLRGVGYEPGEPVEGVGQYSLRGGIIDIFSPESEWPVRIEFFGDQIDSVREFDPSSQRSRKAVPQVRLLPLVEIKRSPEFFLQLTRAMIARSQQRGRRPSSAAPENPLPQPREGAAEPEWASLYSGPFPGWEFLAPLAHGESHLLMSLFHQPVLVWDEWDDRNQQLQQAIEALTEQYNQVRDMVPPPPRPEEVFLRADEFRTAIEPLPQVALSELAIHTQAPQAHSPGGDQLSVDETGTEHSTSQIQQEFTLTSQPSPKYHGAIKPMMQDLRERRARGEAITFVIPSAGKIDRLREILKEYEVPFTSADDAKQSAGASQDAGSGISPGPAHTAMPVVLPFGMMDDGVAFPDLKVLYVSDNDLFGRFDWGGQARKERSAISSFLSDLSDLKVGDYVVHVDHGIGLYQGLKQLGVDGKPRDFMLLTYQEEARLYVPLERLDLVEKYRRSGDGAKPTLDRLGGATWARTKSRVKRSLRDMAEELLRLYADRKMRGGVAYSTDSTWQHEFEDAFEFEETPDQLAAIADIKKDLESAQPMDRLLCGDVGYGKTELAMRAAFKVVQDGKQVAVLAPTTVLSFQHFTTFRQRMAAFPIRIEMLSRFRSAAEQKQIVADTEAGRVDILIGTHRMLSKDVRFRDLGLLVVDEEQRFGVAAKEKLKKLTAGVDVLTMSATPIPRTLHMSIGGLRDLSVIETPPRGRLAIQTVVAPFSDGIVQSAILHEMERTGQVYFVHNRVESIFTIAALLQRLVPSARIGIAHGQMGEKELERVMLKFMRGGYDVLAATALIENGLDIPRANTMIVNHADRFGLADLYQLRGRVGRSDRRAYAYFLIPAQDALTPTAKRRLAALKEFSDLGAGFRLAALDLELRGAGNLLGAEQSGHMNAVGIDMYLQMLEQTVEELKGAPAQPEVRTALNLGLDIKIPDSYIEDESQRLRMYKRISGLSQPEARVELEAELRDRFGAIPPSVSNLLNYAILKSVAEAMLVQSIERKGDQVWIRFNPQAPIDPSKLTQFVRRNREASFRPEGALRFVIKGPDAGLPEQIASTLQQLHQ